jgi:hypothetical protein
METAQQTHRRGELRFGLRSVLLMIATLMFILAVFFDENAFDVAMIGLACLSGALLIGDLGVDRRISVD